ncbi:MAG: T9SS type A sorting domain-containing protein [Saprospiraceae bacterium]
MIENPIPANQNLEVSGSETLTFSADIIKPNPNTQKYEWILNGKIIAGQQESIEITFGTCESYELVLAVTDTTPLVRFDEKFAHIYPSSYQEHRWNITQLNPVSTDLSVTHLLKCDLLRICYRTVEFEINGGQAPYAVYTSTVQLENPALGLEPGVYSIDVVDAHGCRITDEFVIEQDRLLDPEICSEFIAGQWNLLVQDGLYSNSELSVSWSTGANTFDLNELNDGQYSVTVTTDNGCSAVRSIDLVYADNALSAESLAFPSGLTNPSGRIYLQIEHGRPPYSISWFDKPNKDLTDNQSGTTLASGTNFGHIPEYAFDNSLNTKWLQNISSNAFIGYQFPTAVELKSYSITSADDVPERDPKDWLFQGSNNGSSWETLDQQTGFDFNSRFEKRSFLLNNSGSFTHYRLFVLSNHGNSAIQLQELEFTGVDAAEDFAKNESVSDQDFRTSLFPSLYKYEIKDSNQTAWVDSVTIDCIESSSTPIFEVVQANSCQVRVEPDSPGFTYYWMADKEGEALLHTGSDFQPPASGNYFLFVAENTTNSMSEQPWGFAVTMPNAPELSPDTDTILSVLNPDPALMYNWYAADECATPIGQGTQFQPSQPGMYYVSAYKPTDHPDPIDPNSVGEILIRMDASDLNGDGQRDNPAPPSGSTYGWDFENGNKWSAGSWFAYRGNYQNGLGIADFGTIWLQRIENQEVGYQTVLMAYQENPLSFPESAPFESLSSSFPKHADGSQILSNNTPANTLNGSFYWNGEQVDPLNSVNDFQFNIMGAVLASSSNYPVFYTDTYWEGKLGELILYKNALTEEEVLGVSEYLRQKWISTAELESPRTAVQFGTSSESTSTANELDLILSPNPATNHLTVRGLTRASMLKIYSASGQLCASYEASQERMVLPVRDLLPGTYYLSVQDTKMGIHRVEKFIKQ